MHRLGNRLDRLKLAVASAWAKSFAWGRPENEPFRTAIRDVSRLSWPIATAMLGETAMGLVDTKLVGGLGAAALGGVGVGTVLMFLSYNLVYGLMRGVKVRVAYAAGRGTPEDGHRYAVSGVVMGFAVGVLIWAACRDVSPLLRLLRIDPEIIPYGRDFLAAFTCGAPASCALASLIQHRQGLGDSRTPMVVTLLGNAINAVLAWALIYGHWGLPALGVRGAGYGTAAAEFVEIGIMLLVLAREARHAEKRSTLSLREAAREVVELGLPTGLQFTAETAAFSTFTAVLGGIGGAEIAAHQVALATIRVSFLPGIAVGEAASVLVGQSLAKKRLPDADRQTKAALFVAMSFMAACGVVFALLGGVIARAFTNDEAVAHIATRLLLVAAVFQVLDAANLVLRGALRGAKDVRIPAMIGIAVVWTSVPLSAIVLGKMLGWGALGGWLGFLLETILGSSLFAWRWKKGEWRHTHGPAPDESLDRGLVAAA